MEGRRRDGSYPKALFSGRARAPSAAERSESSGLGTGGWSDDASEKGSDLLSRGTYRLPDVSTARGPAVQRRVAITLVRHNSDLERHLYQLQRLRAAQD